MNSKNVIYRTTKYYFLGGILLAIAPGQISGTEDTGALIQRRGWAILFDPELLRGTMLAQKTHQYLFFSYEVNKALHMKDSEQETIVCCQGNLREKINFPQNKYIQAILDTLRAIQFNY